MLFLGTAGAVPTSQRAPSACLIRRGGERILVDCGEGTQRQMLRSSAGLADIDLALITHFHACAAARPRCRFSARAGCAR